MIRLNKGWGLVLLVGQLLACGTDRAADEKPLKPGVTQLDIFHFFSEGASIQPELAEQGKRFEAENPQYQIKWTWGGSESMQKIRARINAGDPPDAALASDADVTFLARENVAMALDDYLAGQNYEADARWQDTFWPGVLEHSLVADGAQGSHYYGIPWDAHISGIYYNKGLFASKGYSTPKTWDQLVGLCQTIQSEAGIACFSADNFNAYNARLHLYIIVRLVGENILYDTATNLAGTSWTGHPGFLEAARIAGEFTAKYYMPGWQGNQWPTGQMEWSNGGAAMIIMPTWLPPELRDVKAEDFVMDIFPFPYFEAGGGDPEVAEIKYNGWFIPTGAANPKGAIHFLKFLSSRTAQRENMETGQVPPVIKGVPLPKGAKGVGPILKGSGGMRFGAGLDADAREWLDKVFYPLNDQLLQGQLGAQVFIERLQKEHEKFYASRPAGKKMGL
jgi:ABC-type glycerol-3-phosphate transport system substrate-binding protein